MSDDMERMRQLRRLRQATRPAGAFDRNAFSDAAAAERRNPAAYYAGKTPTPQRITAALDMRELYGPEVDQALGGEEPMVDEWESGVRIPTLTQMQALAELTGFPVKFFYLPPSPPITGGWICGSDGCHPLGVGTAACPHCRQPAPL